MSDRPTIVDLRIAGVGAARLARGDDHSLVYRAAHETRGHEVDVEVLPGSQGEAARERFAREQRALGRLAGVDGVVPLLEAGVTVDGDLYLMTPTLGGRTLAEIIATDGPMPWPEATRIVEAVATTLHHAHVVGVTHRRVDPDSIVVADDGQVLVTGLGSAGLTMDAAGVSLPAVDRPGYSAPELSDANAVGADAGPACDIYGLGTTLWALLAGRRPFTAADGDDDPVAVTERATTLRVGDLRAVAPPSVAEAIEWATTVEPERRPSSAATFARALREAAARAPSGFLPDPDAVVAGWQPLAEPGDSGRRDEAATDGDDDLGPEVAAAAAGLAAQWPVADDHAHADVSTRDHGITAPIDPPPAPGDRVLPRTAPPDGHSGEEASDGSDDSRRAGLLVGLGIAAIALVALAASAVLVAFVGDDEPVTISGPSIDGEEVGEEEGAEVPAEVLGVEIEAEPDGTSTQPDGGTGTDTGTVADAGAGERSDEDLEGSTSPSAVIEPFAIPTPTPVATVLPAAPAGAPAAGPTRPPTQPAATTTPTPGTIISAPPPPRSPRPAATPTPETTISAPPAPPPAPTNSPTPIPAITPAETPTAVPPTVTPVPPTATPAATTTPASTPPTTDPTDAGGG